MVLNGPKEEAVGAAKGWKTEVQGTALKTLENH